MKGSNRLGFSESSPVPHLGQARPPSPGNRKGPSVVFRTSMTSRVGCFRTSAVAGWNSPQNTRSRAYQSRSPAETWSSFSSRAAVKSYSTYRLK